MEYIKDKLSVILGVIVFVILCGGILYYMENGESYFYTQIDNTKIKSITSSDEMKYEYTLTCYDENGKSREIKFKTSRELREDAYLKLKVLSVNGVNNWEKMQYYDLPSKVQEKYKN